MSRPAATLLLALFLAGGPSRGEEPGQQAGPAAASERCGFAAIQAAKSERQTKLGLPGEIGDETRLGAEQWRQVLAVNRALEAECPRHPHLAMDSFSVTNRPEFSAEERLAAAEAVAAAYAARRAEVATAWPGTLMVAEALIDAELDPARSLAILEEAREDFAAYLERPAAKAGAPAGRAAKTAALLPLLEARLRLRLGEAEKARELLAEAHRQIAAAELAQREDHLTRHYAAARGELLAALPGVAAPPELKIEAPLPAGMFREADFPLEGWPFDDPSGRRFRIEDVAGKTWLVNLWATWCGPCMAELPHIQKLHEELAGRPDVGVISLNFDADVKRVKPFLAKKGYTFPVLLTAGKLDARVKEGIPQNWLLDRAGQVRRRATGFDSEHPEAFLERVRQELAALGGQ